MDSKLTALKWQLYTPHKLTHPYQIASKLGLTCHKNDGPKAGWDLRHGEKVVGFIPELGRTFRVVNNSNLTEKAGAFARIIQDD